MKGRFDETCALPFSGEIRPASLARLREAEKMVNSSQSGEAHDSHSCSFGIFTNQPDSSPINSLASRMQNDLNPSNTSLSPVGNSHALPSSPIQAGRKRKAPSGSRGVASLTPDQLAKKRANDREAQRAIRERTKQQIESLERRIEELTSQQPYQELQAVIKQKDAIQAENDEIRRRLASVMSIIQPIVGAQGLTGIVSTRIDDMSVFNPVRSRNSCAAQCPDSDRPATQRFPSQQPPTFRSLP